MIINQANFWFGTLGGGEAMAVERIAANVAADRPADAEAFYAGVLGMYSGHAPGLGPWLDRCLRRRGLIRPADQHRDRGRIGHPVPDLSVEVDDLDAVLGRVRPAGLPVEYRPAVEPWGVRRFFTRDPFGRLVDILAHA